MDQLIYVDFRKKVVTNRLGIPKVTTWKCSLCLIGYTHVEGDHNNIRQIVGGAHDKQVIICEVCIRESSDILNSLGGSE